MLGDPKGTPPKPRTETPSIFDSIMHSVTQNVTDAVGMVSSTYDWLSGGSKKPGGRDPNVEYAPVEETDEMAFGRFEPRSAVKPTDSPFYFGDEILSVKGVKGDTVVLDGPGYKKYEELKREKPDLSIVTPVGGPSKVAKMTPRDEFYDAKGFYDVPANVYLGRNLTKAVLDFVDTGEGVERADRMARYAQELTAEQRREVSAARAAGGDEAGILKMMSMYAGGRGAKVLSEQKEEYYALTTTMREVLGKKDADPESDADRRQFFKATMREYGKSLEQIGVKPYSRGFITAMGTLLMETGEGGVFREDNHLPLKFGYSVREDLTSAAQSDLPGLFNVRGKGTHHFTGDRNMAEIAKVMGLGKVQSRMYFDPAYHVPMMVGFYSIKMAKDVEAITGKPLAENSPEELVRAFPTLMQRLPADAKSARKKVNRYDSNLDRAPKQFARAMELYSQVSGYKPTRDQQEALRLFTYEKPRP